MAKIIIEVGKHSVIAEIFDTDTGRAILEALPFQSQANTWGNEIYFSVPANTILEPGARAEVQIGDLAYWPTMPAFCIFFGPTPASYGDEPRAASAVNVFGKLLNVDLSILQSVRDGDRVACRRKL